MKEVLIHAKMSKGHQEEWAFFLNDRNGITYAELCRRCAHDCKQSFHVTVLTCPFYISKRRSESH